MRIFIIEDETLARAELKRLLAIARPGYVLAGEADGIESAAAALPSADAELILMDIQLSDGQSFALFDRLEITVPVIFTTAYDAYAIQAFRVYAIDYLLKPIEPALLEQALTRAERRADATVATGTPQTAITMQALRQMMAEAATSATQATPYKTRFVTQMGERIRHIAQEEVAYFASEQETTILTTTDGRRHILPQSLEALLPQLDPARFFKVSRQYIVSLPAIGEIHKYFNARLKLTLTPTPPTEVLVSRQRVPDFMAWLDR